MTNNLFPPVYGAETFTCPYCDVHGTHEWYEEYDDVDGAPSPGTICLSKCHDCGKSCLWVDKKLVVPDKHGMPPPNDNLSADVKELYNVAAYVAQRSPRAAAALLRLALEKLLGELGYKEGNLCETIDNFVKDNELSQEIKKTMDTIRNAGNAAVHDDKKRNIDEYPGIETVLFRCINEIVKAILTEECIKKRSPK